MTTAAQHVQKTKHLASKKYTPNVQTFGTYFCLSGISILIMMSSELILLHCSDVPVFFESILLLFKCWMCVYYEMQQFTCIYTYVANCYGGHAYKHNWIC